MKPTILFTKFMIFFFVLSFSSLQAQYVRQYQAVYPYDHGTISSETNAMTTLSSGTRYNMLTSPELNTSVTGIGIVELNNNLELIDDIVYGSADYRTAHFTNMDIIETANGEKLVCGSMKYNNVEQAFIAKFDAHAANVWAYTYPDVTIFNAIAEDPSPIDIGIQYVACGAKRNGNASAAYVMGIAANGQAQWAKGLLLTTVVTNSEYKDIKFFEEARSGYPRFAVTGWIDRGLTYQQKEVILSKIDIRGNTYMNHYYYHPLVTGNEGYYEEGLGLTVDRYGKYIYITGPASNHPRTSALRDYADVLIYKIRSTDGAIIFTKHFDAKGQGAYEYGTAVKVKDTLVVATGFQKGDLFNPNSSIDAFLIATNDSGDPLRLRVYGSGGTDMLMDVHENNVGDGALMVGYSDSWSRSLGLYYPYIVEAYMSYNQECNSLKYELRDYSMTMAAGTFSLTRITPSESAKRLQKMTADLDRHVLCAKVPSPIISKPTSRMSNDAVQEEIRLYPSVTSSEITVEGLQSEAAYKIVSMTGAVVKQGMFSGNAHETLNVSDMNAGVYLIRIEATTGAQTYRFIKQ